jgi:hypothetical protein
MTMTSHPFCSSCGGQAVVSGVCSSCGMRQPGTEAHFRRAARPRRPKGHTHSPPRYVPPAAPGDLSLRQQTAPRLSKLTSEEARQRLLDELRRLGGEGERCDVEGGCRGHASDERLSELTGISRTTVPARRGELQAAGKVLRYGKTTTSYGKPADLNHLIEKDPEETA